MLLELARPRADQWLDSSERRFRGLVEALPGYVYTCPLDFTRSISPSHQVLDLTGYTSQEHWADPKLWIGMVHVDDRERVLDSLCTAMAHGEPVNCEYRVNHRDGSIRWLRDHAVKVSGANRDHAYYQGVVLEITDPKEAEMARAESLAKSRFLAAMSHELRNPLNTVLGFAELLQSSGSGTLSEKQARFVRNIRESGRLLLDLVDDLLDFFKVQAGQMTADLQPVSIGEVVANVIERMSPIAGAKGIRLLATGKRCDVPALADRRRLTQVLLNLVSNAVKFTPADGSVTVRSSVVAEGIRVAVTDTGIGIPPKEQARIFQEFVQVDNEHTRSQNGTGLGLALSKGLMALMGGSIGVASLPGHGSTFTITLQRAPAADATTSKAVA